MTSTAESAGGNCATGGVKLEFGIDADGSGALDSGEVNSALTRYVCNGAVGATGNTGATGATGSTGANGLNALVSSTVELAGGNCATGGVKLEFGIDSDGGGALDPGEVNSALTRYVCNGAVGATGSTGATGPTGPIGHSALVVGASEPVGINCPTGGTRLDFGIDANDNGSLDGGEIDILATRYVCTGEQGPTGATGSTGPTGATGATGANGLNALSRTVAEAMGANCTTGGVKLEFGVDADSSGVLDNGEVNSALTRYVCNGEQGPAGATGSTGPAGATGATGASGLNALSRTVAEAMGANCTTGGVKLEFGVDADSSGVLDNGEVNSALTRYVCNGEQGPAGATGSTGPAGATGPAGPTGATGPQGPAGSMGAYGDGSAGALNVSLGNTLDLSSSVVVSSLPGGVNMQFTSITIAGTLIIPSGITLKATGNVSITGTVTVLHGSEDSGAGDPSPGVARSGASTFAGGLGLTSLQASRALKPVSSNGGGSGSRIPTNSGSQGGGFFMVMAQGSISVPVGGLINANGAAGVNPFTAGAGIVGAGGGAGGVVILLSNTSITVGGSVQAQGANGSDGFDGNGGSGEGGGGGGGGGIIHLIAPVAPTVTGTLSVSGGAGGNNAIGSSSTISQGGGGGGCGGSGGTGGGGTNSAPIAPTAGSTGHALQTVVPAPEQFIL